MKYTSFICLLTATMFLFSCEEGDGPLSDNEKEENAEVLAAAMDEIDRNVELLGVIMDASAEQVDVDTIAYFLNESATRAEYLRNMSMQLDGLFEKIIQQNNDYINTAGINFGPGIISEERAAYWSRILETEDPIQAYYDLLVPVIDQADEEHRDWIILQSFMNENEEMIELPLEQSTLTRREARVVINMKDLVLDGPENGVETSAIEEIFVTNSIPEPYAGLLLPAVQRVREVTSNQPFNTWIEANTEQGINGGLHRDIIRRLQVVSLLSTIDLILNEEYDRADQDGFSVGLMQTLHEAYWMFIWNDYWVEKP